MADQGSRDSADLALDCEAMLDHVWRNSLALAVGVFDAQGNALYLNQVMEQLAF